MIKLTKKTLKQLFRKVIEKWTNTKGKECLYVYATKDSNPVDWVEKDKNLYSKYILWLEI